MRYTKDRMVIEYPTYTVRAETLIEAESKVREVFHGGYGLKLVSVVETPECALCRLRGDVDK